MTVCGFLVGHHSLIILSLAVVIALVWGFALGWFVRSKRWPSVVHR